MTETPADSRCPLPDWRRVTSGYPKRKRAAAGYWGDYRRCDTPLRTIENMLQQIADVHGPVRNRPPSVIPGSRNHPPVKSTARASPILRCRLYSVPMKADITA